MAEIIIDNIDAIIAGTFKYRPNKKPVSEKLAEGDRVLIKDAWEDRDGKTGDAYAKILHIDKKGKLKLEYESIEITEVLKGFVYTIKDVQLAPTE